MKIFKNKKLKLDKVSLPISDITPYIMILLIFISILILIK